jgi:hypothetical protein
MTRSQFERFWQTREPCAVAMEACGTAHHWARHVIALGFEVTLPPPKYVCPYRKRNAPMTSLGVGIGVLRAPMPSCPAQFPPQQYACPEVVIPQV